MTLPLPAGLRAAGLLGLLSLTAAPALGADQTQALGQALSAAPSTPAMAVACAPAGTVLTTLGQVMAAGAGQLDPTGRALVEAMARPDGLAELGIDGQGVLSLLLWDPRGEPKGVLALPFAGDAAAAEAMLRSLGSAPVPVADQVATWTTTDDGATTVARLDGGMLSLAFDGQAPSESALPAVDLPLVDGLPHDPGCALWAAANADTLPGPEGIKPRKGLVLAGFVPFERGQQGLLRLRPGGPLPDALRRAGVAPVTGTASEPPSVVVSLAPSVADLLLDPTVQQALDLRPGQARKAVRALNVGPGATIAAFGPPEAMDFVAMLPLEGSRARTDGARVARRIKRLARKLGGDVLHATPSTLVVAAGQRHLHVETRDGRVVVAADGPRARMAADGEGAPWVRPEDLGWALEWPVALWTGAGGPGAGGYAVRVRAGLRADPPEPEAAGDVLELGLQVQTTAPPGVLGAFLTALASQQLASPRSALQSSADPLGELERDLEGIALAQERYRAAHGSYLATPEAPRALSALDAQAHPWLAPGAWSELGWAPDPPVVQGVYQVEIQGDGYVVHGWLDLDGDGVPAHYQRTHDAPMQRLTPEDVR